jgi:HAD superfamily hydrolase (TIGR01490 family)
VSACVEAAFFDLDKTVIARASMVAFGRPLYRRGFLSRRLLLRGLWAQLVYLHLGADEARLARMRDAVLALTKGWDHAEVSAIVRETLEDVVEPIIFGEALELIEEHRSAGRLVYIVSASPEEIVAPLAQYLNADGAIATRALLDSEGRYTGKVELYAYGAEKVVAMRDVANRHGIDMAASYAYSDSATDLPMLEAVGHPVVVNPDRELARVARQREWEVRRFVQRVRLRDRVPTPPPGPAAAVGGALAAGSAGVWVWLMRRRRPQPPPPRARWRAPSLPRRLPARRGR